MPVLFRYKGFRFFFYLNEGHPREPVHVHVRSGDGSEAKFWLRPQVRLASNDGFDARTLRELATEVQDKQTMIEEHWHEYFG